MLQCLPIKNLLKKGRMEEGKLCSTLVTEGSLHVLHLTAAAAVKCKKKILYNLQLDQMTDVHVQMRIRDMCLTNNYQKIDSF